MAQSSPSFAPSKAEYRRLADEMEANLQSQVLAKWYPTAVDTLRGGFHQNYREDWTLDPRENRSLVYQSRLTWLAAAVAKRYPAKAKAYKGFSLHGLELLLSAHRQRRGNLLAEEQSAAAGRGKVLRLRRARRRRGRVARGSIRIFHRSSRRRLPQFRYAVRSVRRRLQVGLRGR